jgi:hypothetical protein
MLMKDGGMEEQGGFRRENGGEFRSVRLRAAGAGQRSKQEQERRDKKAIDHHTKSVASRHLRTWCWISRGITPEDELRAVEVEYV